MDIVEAIRSRKSIRGFKPDPVSQEVVRELLEIATRAPSGYNTQPWEITVVTGEVLDNIKRENIEMFRSGAAPRPDAAMRPYEGIYRERQVALAIQIFQLMGIAREDKERRAEWMERGIRFFDAPVGIILSVDSSLDPIAPMMDIGAFFQNICLAALHYGLGTCIHGQGILYPDVIRRIADIPQSKRIVESISIGYPDWDFPANRLETKREPVERITAWRGFD